jgi:hypothetical protein
MKTTLFDVLVLAALAIAASAYSFWSLSYAKPPQAQVYNSAPPQHFNATYQHDGKTILNNGEGW